MPRSVLGAVLTASLAYVLAAGAGADDELVRGFGNPPQAAKPWVYWFVMDGNLDREGITADLEALQRVGIGGVLFMEVDVGIPKGPVKFMSPPWRELFKHANQEAARLGLVITMPASPGWTGSGGPWVKPEQSMQKLVCSELNLTGPQRFAGPLPAPPTVAGFYREVQVLAFPTPAEAYRIADIQEKALYHRGHFSSERGVKPSLPAPPTHPTLTAGQVIPKDQIVDLTDRLDGHGRLAWDVPAGAWTVLRFGHTSTGANTRPAPEPGLGLECDKLDKTALESHFHDFLGKLLADIGPLTGKSLVALHIDSWEMGPQNWTSKLPGEFQQRRGYALHRYLPVMTGRVVDSLEVSERFLWDLRQTILELIAENHAGHLAELAHQHGLQLSIEPYDGTPCDDMTYGARADVPMGEFWRDTFSTWFSCTEASSIAHVYGKRIVQAEAFTSGDGERWLAHPATLKALGDWAYCDGINRFVFHRYAHQPWRDRWPGMTMGPYGIHYERTQTWWAQSQAWLQYLSRCQFLLQQGLAVADVCCLLPEASPQVFRPSATATRGIPPTRLGYNFDGCTPEALLTRMSVQDGRLVLPDGMSYRLLVLPNTQTMTPRLLGKVKELVEAGATILGPRPLKSPSLANFPQCDEELQRLADALWGPGPSPPELREHACGQGRVYSGPGLAASTDAATAVVQHPLEKARWIWHNEGHPAASAPVGKRYFRRVFALPAGQNIQSAVAVMTADNAFELWVNGRRAGAGNNFHVADTMNVAPLLKPGVNVLAVTAENGSDAPNPAGLIGAVAIRFDDGLALALNTDGKWETATSVQDGWTAAATTEGWTPALELGPLGMQPWGEVARPSASSDVFPDFKNVMDLFTRLGVPPDFESDQDLRYTHRRRGDTEIYFVANGQPADVAANCTFRVSGKTPELWDPITGERRPASAFKQQLGRTTVPLELGPHGSLFVIFRQPTDAAQSDGRNFPKFTTLQELRGPWSVQFAPRWGGPESVVFNTLTDWTKRPEPGIKYYSGTATYRRVFDVHPELSPAKARTLLDLGRVQVLAQVRLNGRELGTRWTPPYRVDITDAIKTGENTLEVSVVNLWPNRMIGDQFLPPEQRYTSSTWNPFTKTSPLLESGLLGPVTLQGTSE